MNPGPGRAQLILWVFAVSGFTSLALEVVWTRVLTLFLRPTVYGFALMLAAILAGIAIGSYIVTPFLDRRRKWIAILAGLELAIGIAAVLSFGLLAQMGPLAASLTPALSTDGRVARLSDRRQPAGNLSDGAADGPRVSDRPASVDRRRRRRHAHVGNSHRHVLFIERGRRDSRRRSPRDSSCCRGSASRSSLIALGVISFAGGLLLLAVVGIATADTGGIGLIASLVFAGCCRWPSDDPFEEFLAQRYRGQQLIWREEGVEATSAVVVSGSGEVSLTVNGNHQASTGPVMTFVHRAIGHLPMMLHPEARDVLVIGLGGGATAGAVSIHDGVDVDAVELAGSVARGARFLDSINYNVLTPPERAPAHRRWPELHAADAPQVRRGDRRRHPADFRRIRKPVFTANTSESPGAC